MKPRRPVVDYFGRELHIGDLFFIGNPPTFGKVIKIRDKSIMLDVGVDRHNANATMNVGDPSKGIITSKLDGKEPLG